MDEFIVNGQVGKVWKYILVHHIESTSVENDYGHSEIEDVAEKIIKGVMTKSNEPTKWIQKGLFEGKTSSLVTPDKLELNDWVFFNGIQFRVSLKKRAKWDMNFGHYEYELEKVGNYE